MKIHITDAYTLNNTAKRKTTQYRYETTDVVEKNEIPLINYYDGNWITKSTTDNSIQGYDNEGFRTSNVFGSTYYSVRSNTAEDKLLSSFYINNVPSNTDYNHTYNRLDFTYYGNYKVNFIPIPAHYFRYEIDPETQTYTGDIERIDTTFYISIARVTKDNTYSKSHYAEFSKLSNDPYLKGVINDNVSHNDPQFTYWQFGGSSYGDRSRSFTDYIDLGNIIPELDGVYVPKNMDSYIPVYKFGVSQSFKVSQIKSTVLPNNVLKYYASGPIHYSYNEFNYVMDFRFLPYSATIKDCYEYKYSQNTSELILDNLVNYDTFSNTANIRFNDNIYTVASQTMLYIGLNEFMLWYKNKLEGVEDNYILNRYHYRDDTMETTENKIYIDCDINYCQAVINEVKRLYNDSCFDIHLYDNGFHDDVFESRYQAGKYTTRNITEKITIKEDNYFKTI